MQVYRWITPLLFFSMVLLLPVRESRAEPVHVGRIALSVKNVEIVEQGEARRAKFGEKLFAHQTIRTGEGAKVTIRFRDGSSLTLGPDGALELQKFAFSPVDSQTTKLVKVHQGAYRYLSGFKVKRQDVKINTPVASMGVRGTALEGLIAPDAPVFAFLSDGRGVMSNAKGAQEIKQGQSSASMQGNGPMPPAQMPLEMTSSLLQEIQAQLGDNSKESQQGFTKEMLEEDARASRLPLYQQLGLANPVEGETEGLVPSAPTQSDNRLMQQLKRLALAAGHGWDAAWAEKLTLSFVSSAHAQGVAQALTMLRQAAELGLLSPRGPGEALSAAQQAFVAQVQAANPQAAQILSQSVANQKAAQQSNQSQSTDAIIRSTAATATDAKEVGKVVGNAVQATGQTELTIAKALVQVIVQSALSVPGKTDNTASAIELAAVAAKAYPAVAGDVASAAVTGLPAAQQSAAASQVAAAAAAAAPQSAVAVAGQVAAVSNPNQAAQVAASVAQAAGPVQAAAVAAEVTRVAGEGSAALVAASVAKVAGGQAAAIAAAVTQQAKGQGGNIAAAVTQSAGAQNAAAVAGAVAKTVGGADAAKVAAAVASVAPEQAAAIAGAVVKEAGAQNMASVAAAVTQTNKRSAVAIAVAIAKATGTKDAQSMGLIIASVGGVAGEQKQELTNALALSSGQTTEALNQVANASEAQVAQQVQAAVVQSNEAATQAAATVQETAQAATDAGNTAAQDSVAGQQAATNANDAVNTNDNPPTGTEGQQETNQETQQETQQEEQQFDEADEAATTPEEKDASGN
ncbi:hypothetical protein Mmc1_0811 [Magnetococcus marinus MC-1]|uniref:FecR protein domain-containing protein n=1 Tax=Magnetococcus marinus (strain ATCC BAA-1437 / JCM 17883 / MC-1) TaxID=156889 RepID=A0L5T7_MAGMM|nr:FecR family protein [Magnetococcus marinus]ABK43330.1 hypothetical protein Mmc1_0811 [Magnetococcus marinus MC-1]